MSRLNEIPDVQRRIVFASNESFASHSQRKMVPKFRRGFPAIGFKQNDLLKARIPTKGLCVDFGLAEKLDAGRCRADSFFSDNSDSTWFANRDAKDPTAGSLHGLPHCWYFFANYAGLAHGFSASWSVEVLTCVLKGLPVRFVYPYTPRPVTP